MKKVNAEMTAAIDSVASDEVAAELKREFGIDDKLAEVRKLASQSYPGIGIYHMLTGDKIRNKKEELKNSTDIDDRKRLKKEIMELQNENLMREQIMDASSSLRALNRLESKVRETKKRTLKSDLRDLYETYGAEAIEELLKAE
jgi:hypothetical protein